MHNHDSTEPLPPVMTYIIRSEGDFHHVTQRVVSSDGLQAVVASVERENRDAWAQECVWSDQVGLERPGPYRIVSVTMRRAKPGERSGIIDSGGNG